jgi:hypothetical protein
MLNASDLARMQADLADIIADNAATIQIRRDVGTAPGPQTVRVEAAGKNRSRLFRSEAGEETRLGIVVVGDAGLDIRVDDRFTWNDTLYRVTAIRPNTQMGIQAEADRVE